MDNLIFCLNVTVPIFLTLLLGYFFRRIGLFDETFVNRMNKFVLNKIAARWPAEAVAQLSFLNNKIGNGNSYHHLIL